jgi:NAD(P)-dependent dehydrogenase (short-subunit alcohol dehydrogenase family)
MSRLQGKSAIVTGAGSGIGRATSILFAQNGASVVCVDRADSVAATAETILKAGGRAIALNKDVSKESDVIEFIDAAVKQHGGLDICYANAGVSGGLPMMDEITTDDWQRVLNINLVGAFLTVKHAAKVMAKAKRGSIICTASVAGLRSGAGGITYSASKAGVIAMVQTVANQLGGTGVRINAICPGLIETGMTKPLFDRARERGTEHKIGQLNPLRRYGRPEEIAGAALFLASDDSSYVNGIALPVDGGLSSSLPIVPPKM